MGRDTNWPEMIDECAKEHGDSIANVVHSCPSVESEHMKRRFEPGYGSTQGVAFTLWTADRVYFPICYDGMEWVGSVPRNPCDAATEHMGGG